MSPLVARLVLPRRLTSKRRECATQSAHVVRSRWPFIGVDLDQPRHSCGVPDEDDISGPLDDRAEAIHATHIGGHGIPVGRLDQPDDVEAVAPALRGALIPPVEPGMQLAGDQRQAACDRHGDVEVLAAHLDIGGQPGCRPMGRDEKPVLVLEIVRVGTRIEDLDDLELDA